jgi:hypothetical protein
LEELLLAEESILSDDFLRELINVGEVDVLIGVPTYNDAATVGQVVQAIRAGLLKYFPRQRAVIINADGGSKDGTQDLVRAASISDLNHVTNLRALRTLHCVSTRYSGGPAGGNALHTILSAAELVRASTCAVVSPESVSMEPEWIDRLLRSVSGGNLDFVAPIYCRHKYDGLLVRNLLYPLTRALYCRRIREPHPTDYAFSGQFATHMLAQDIWSQELMRIGAETYLVISAITGGFRVGQSFLGPKSRVDQGSADLVHALRQTVGVLFWSLEQNFPACSASAELQPVPTLGLEHGITEEPVRVNRKRLHQMFQRGVAELEPVLSSILDPSTLAELKRGASAPEESFRYSDELWARTAYEFAVAYHKSIISRDHIIQALAPLYRGRAYTFLAENRDASADEVEQHVEGLCLEFEKMKPFLVEKWGVGK